MNLLMNSNVQKIMQRNSFWYNCSGFKLFNVRIWYYTVPNKRKGPNSKAGWENSWKFNKRRDPNKWGEGKMKKQYLKMRYKVKPYIPTPGLIHLFS